MNAVGDLVREAAENVPEHEARELLAYAMGKHAAGYGPADALMWDAPDATGRRRFEELVALRRSGWPLQYLTRVAAFRTCEVAVGPGVFIPRPETEVVTGWAIDQLRTMEDVPVVVELCAGSGAISLAIATELGGCAQYAVERDEAAFAYTSRNLAATGARVVRGDMADAFHDLDGAVDLVIANPPYIPETDVDHLPADVRDHEPTGALFAGPDGLDGVRAVAAAAARLLRPGGRLVCEHGDDQGVAAPAVVAAIGVFDEVDDHSDLTGRPRFVTALRARDPVAGRSIGPDERIHSRVSVSFSDLTQ